MTPTLPVPQTPHRDATRARGTLMRWMLIPLLLVTLGGAAQAQWMDQSPPDIRALRVVHAVSAQVAWAAGIDGEIIRTVDGGQTWEDVRVNATDTSFRWALYAFDDQKCIVGNSFGVVHVTTDGGQTWDLVLGVVTFINGIHFFDDQNGLLMADPLAATQRFVIWRTADGGLNWTEDMNAPSADPDSVAGLYGSHCWTDEDNGIFGTTDFIAWRTENGGANWESVATNNEFVDGLVVSETGGIGLASGDRGRLDRSTDGGASWDSVTSPTPEFAIRNFDWVEGTDQVWGVTGRAESGSLQSRILHSNDAGLTWNQDVVSPAFNAFDISAASDSVVWAVGGDGTIGEARIFRLEPLVAVGDDAPGGTLSDRTILTSSRPNPFYPSTTITFEIPEAGHVKLEIYDAAGRSLRTLVDHRLTGVSHRVVWDGRNDSGQRLGPGVYLYRLQIGNHVASRKLVLLN